jgi:hypothetical protein
MASDMLKGFNYPLTPKGKSTLNPPPPWYYSADFLNIEFWADPSVVAATLPTGLDPDPKAEGRASANFYDWQFSGSNEEYLDPAATSIVSSSFLLTRFMKESLSPIVHTFSWTTMRL